MAICATDCLEIPVSPLNETLLTALASYAEEKVSCIKEINDDEITLEDPVNIKEGQVLYVKVDDGVNGDAIRGKYLEIISYFSVDKEKLLVKSIQLDIDESKI